MWCSSVKACTPLVRLLQFSSLSKTLSIVESHCTAHLRQCRVGLVQGNYPVTEMSGKEAGNALSGFVYVRFMERHIGRRGQQSSAHVGSYTCARSGDGPGSIAWTSTGWVRERTRRAGPARRIPLEMVGSSMIIPFEFCVRNSSLSYVINSVSLIDFPYATLCGFSS